MCSSVYHDGLRMKNTIYFLIFLSCGARVKLDDSAESADPNCWRSTDFLNPDSDCVGSDTHGFLGYADYNCSYKAGCTNPNYRLNTCACGGQQAGSRCEISVGNDPIDSRSFPQNEHGNLYYGTNHCPNETFSLQPTQNGNQVYSIDFAWLGNRGPTPPSQLKMEATKLYCNGSKTNEQLEIPSNFDWNHLEPRSTQTMRYLCHGYSSCTYPYTWNLDAEKCDEDWWLIFRFRILPLSTFEECPIPDSHMLQDRTRGSDCFWVGGNITAKFYQIQGNAQELQTFTVDNATTIYLRESCQRNGGDVIINVKNEAQMEDDIKFLYKEFKDKGTLPDGTEGTDFGVLAFVQAKYYTTTGSTARFSTKGSTDSCIPLDLGPDICNWIVLNLTPLKK
ncbi:unnamed protein product [Cyprideis torosa]|uniref:Uncharacterized protein n=1 Tax=Cyprideis torosa TaxID=163714 RepID=A0A7R8ZRB6_9CRUS|nr:unnamed protein product [Cyprideis torosa]CAG0904751.1 unnamed protein product [Cyprideis torosa]